MRVFALACLLSLLSGCASTDALSYRPANSTGPAWILDGEKSAAGALTIKINGKPAAAGNVNLLTGEGSASGDYEGRQVRAQCSTNEWTGEVKCMVTIGGEFAGNMSFD